MAKNVAVEVDGEYHNTDKQREWDEKRELALNRRGIRVYRLSNSVVLDDPRAAVGKECLKMRDKVLPFIPFRRRRKDREIKAPKAPDRKAA